MDTQSQKDLPIQLLTSSKPLRATLVLASFGSAQAFSNHVFDLALSLDTSKPIPAYEKPLRYGKLPEINHIFRADPQSGPKIFSLVFAAAVLATVPVLLGAVCIHFPNLLGPSTNAFLIVGLPRSQSFSLIESHLRRTNLTRPILWLNHCHGRNLLLILLKLELVPDFTRRRCRRISRILEWEQSAFRSAKSTIGRREIRLWLHRSTKIWRMLRTAYRICDIGVRCTIPKRMESQSVCKLWTLRENDTFVLRFRQ